MHKFLFLLTFALLATNSYALDHYCKDSKNVGRAAYACQAESALRQVLPKVVNGGYILELIKVKELQKQCKTNCTPTCASESESAKKDDKDFDPRECKKSCTEDCLKDYINEYTKHLEAGVKVYLDECEKSEGGSSCEKKEAASFCGLYKDKLLSKKIEIKTAGELNKFKRYYTRMETQFKNRVDGLDKESSDRSVALVSEVNRVTGCKLLPEGTDICTQKLSVIKPTASIEDLAAELSRTKESEAPALVAQCRVPVPTPKPLAKGDCGPYPPIDVRKNWQSYPICTATNKFGVNQSGYEYNNTCCPNPTSTTSSSDTVSCCIVM